jgi:hypothetical protein
MVYTSWFIPLCIVVSTLFTLAVITLTVFTLVFRAKVIAKYDRGKHHV